MAGNILICAMRVLRVQNVRKRMNSIRKISKETWRRLLSAGGLTASSLALGSRLMMPPSFEHDATKLQLGAMQTTSHEQLIRQASTMTVDAATQLLSQTVVAYIEMSHLYREVLKELMDVLSDDLQLVSLESVTGEEGTSAIDLTQELWEQEMDARQRASALRSSLLELSSYMDYVTKVATAAAEASYLAGSDFASTSMCERLNSAHRAFEEEKAKNKEADRELLRLQESHATLGKTDEAGLASLARKKMARSGGVDITLLDPLGDVDNIDEAAAAATASSSSSDANATGNAGSDAKDKSNSSNKTGNKSD